MANLKDIATTLALMGSGAFVLTACDKEKPATEVPGADDPSGVSGDAEGSCAAADHPADGHCGGDASAADAEAPTAEEPALDEGAAEGEGEGEDAEAGEGSCGA